MSALSGIRVIELAHERGAWVGKLLGDMGADVVVVEPPGGAAMRGYGPFVDDLPDRERSLHWWHYNTSKRSVVLDWTQAEGRAALLGLLDTADILIEAEDPGVLTAAGLDDAALTGARPRLIHVSVTPFGPEGPRSNEHATDLTILASGGVVALCGYDDHTVPPIRPSGGHGYAIGGHYAVLSALTALVARELGGTGQRIDVSLNAAANVTTEMASYNWLVAGQQVTRQTGRHASGYPTMQTQYRCLDGRYVNTGVPPRTSRQFATLLEWLAELGLKEDFPETVFLELGMKHPLLDITKLGLDDEITAIAYAAREGLALPAGKMGGREFFIGAQSAGLPVGIVYSPDEAFEDEHFKARGFQVEVAQPQLGRSVRYPGAPYAFEKTPWAISRPAPSLGQHSLELLGEAAVAVDDG